MVFNSIMFLNLFLPTVVICYCLVKDSVKKGLILLASLFFVAWSGFNNLFIVCSMIILNYVFGIILNKKKKKIVIGIGIILNLLILFYFKYFNFSLGYINELFNMNLVLKNIIMPLGISFTFFSCISYLVDIYRGNENKNNFFDFATYILYFPKFVQGPIIKYKDFVIELNSSKVNINDFTDGVVKFIVGLSKKVLIAYILSVTVNLIYSNIAIGVDRPTLILASICYTMQIYFDFSGYSDMAIGISKMLGMKFDENFNFPYLSKSVTEFWRRWHISLGSWFRDYLYIPLGGNRRGNVYFNLFVVFLVTGIWHGASLIFVAWGIWHGIFILIEKFLTKKKLLDKIPSVIRWIAVLLIVNTGWIMFRCGNVNDTVLYFKNLLGLIEANDIIFSFSYYFNTRLIVILMISIFGSTILGLDSIKKVISNIQNYKTAYSIVKYSTCIVLLLGCLICIYSGSYSPFIYFQF